MSAVPVWPCALPCCVLRGAWGMEPVSPNRATEMDDGSVAVTRKLALIRTLTDVGWETNPTEFEIFKAWWRGDLDAGRLWFDGPSYEGGGCTEWRRLRFAAGETPPWRVTQPSNGRLLIAARLEIADLPVISPEDRESLEVEARYVGGVAGLEADLSDLIAEFHELEALL